MKVLYLANNYLGWRIGQVLKEQGDEVVGLVAHPPDRAMFRDEIVSTFDLPAERVISAPTINDPATHDRIRQWQPDVLLSVLFDYILKADTLALAPRGVVNLHNSYLPYNRGNFANVWSIITRTPAGATLHLMDEGIDTGPIIDRIQEPVDLKDTGETLYRRIEIAAEALFRRAWPKFRAGEFAPIEQKHLTPTPTWKKRDVEKIDPIDLDRTYTARELIDILRARTFPPHSGAYIEEGGRKVYLRLQLLDEDEL
ncbi:MAG: formyl transferase [Phycisphaerae bacterium]|nr:formyl transferase [Phycisphaerae bacterium]